ncbi:DNA-binding transcriptional regulator BolA [Hydrogenovibrio crunogenus]|uniref:DNA-binding transcriptional regulator BolA n=1 Tax=Hydrogenovibrio crunogenus TaxID=39765 RepID=A0A4P7NXQ0_9GAMM|nr:BolA family protein [Hydrogenovibrio crunogenus]QBZ82550.1 DNA-binding transcriptional regulator BolA [Hydrogenovibrio crunogenus]
MSLQQQIENKINGAFDVTFMQMENESHMHSGPAQESHFKLTLVSPAFEGMNKVKRHQAVYKALAEEMPLFHALALHTYSPSEWEEKPTVAASPLCQGGSKA